MASEIKMAEATQDREHLDFPEEIGASNDNDELEVVKDFTWQSILAVVVSIFLQRPCDYHCC